MVTPACYTTSEAGRRYSRACPPYPIVTYPDHRRFQISTHHDSRPPTMTEREADDSSQPRKRIAVACGRCRKRKIRCSGDPGNGLPCSNCKNAGHEPCLFLRVASTETPMRDNEFGYNVETARVYQAHRGTASPLATTSVSQYGAADMPGGDVMYRQSTYPYGTTKNATTTSYYPAAAVSGWGAAYADDGVDYGLNYSSYPHLNQDPVHMVPATPPHPQGYRYGSSKSAAAAQQAAAAQAQAVYVEAPPEVSSSYTYGNLVHRPAVNSDLPNFSLSGMAASLPATSERLPTVNRTLTSSSPAYRNDGLPGHYSAPSTGKSSSSSNAPQPSPAQAVADVGYGGISGTFESPVSYSSTATLPSNVSSRTASQSEGTYEQQSGGALTGTTAGEGVYRTVHESDSYIYSDNRRDSQSSGGGSSGSVLSNGHAYVPEPHHSHAHAHHTHAQSAAHAHHHHHNHHRGHHHSSQSYVVSAAAAGSQQPDGATTAAGSGSGTASATGHRRSAGSLRGA